MIGGAGGVSSLLPFDGVDKRGVFSDDIFLLVAIVSQGNQLTSIGQLQRAYAFVCSVFRRIHSLRVGIRRVVPRE